MENFDLESYYSELEKSQSINECPKVPLPKIREDQNYIFVSYAHTDYKDVYKTLAFLYANGVRFWYDVNLQGGDDWTEKAKSLIKNKNCKGVIFFNSPEAFKAEAVHNERLWTLERIAAEKAKAEEDAKGGGKKRRGLFGLFNRHS